METLIRLHISVADLDLRCLLHLPYINMYIVYRLSHCTFVHDLYKSALPEQILVSTVCESTQDRVEDE